MKRESKISIIAIIFLFTSFVVFILFSALNESKRNLSYNFAGVVDSVAYDIKGIPTVIVKNKEYYLSAGYNFDFQIKKGDSLKKKGGATIYVLVKKGTNKMMIFDN